jgi:hypothetical protein
MIFRSPSIGRRCRPCHRPISGGDVKRLTCPRKRGACHPAPYPNSAVTALAFTNSRGWFR